MVQFAANLVQNPVFRAPLLALLFVSYSVLKIGTFLAYECDCKISVANSVFHDTGGYLACQQQMFWL